MTTENFLRIPNTAAGVAGDVTEPTGAFPPITWPMDQVTQQTLRRWLFKTLDEPGEVGDTIINNIITQAPGGGSSTPAGADRNIQFNNANAFGADADFDWVTGAVASGGGDAVIRFGASNYSPFYVGIVQSEPAIALPQGTNDFFIGPFDTVAGGSDYNGGDVQIFALDSGASSPNLPGQVWLQGGYNTFFNSTGAEIHVAGGGAGAQGGSINFLGGDSGSFDGSGGDIRIQPGALNGAGFHGKIIMSGPTNGFSRRAIGGLTTSDNSFHAVGDVVSLTEVGPVGYLHARVVGYDAGNGDLLAAEFTQAFKTTAGPTLSLVGSLNFIFFYGDAALADVQFAVNGTDIVELQVKGDTGRDYTWQYEFWYMGVN